MRCGTMFYSVVLYLNTLIFASSESHFERRLDLDFGIGVLVFIASSIWDLLTFRYLRRVTQSFCGNLRCY
jgi:hypothetical protein